MKNNKDKFKLFSTVSLSLALSACFSPPYNNFNPEHKVLKSTAIGAGGGAAVGALAGSAAIGTAIGGTAALAISGYKETRQGLINQLNNDSIQYVEYGNTRTLLIPTDKYYLFGTSKLNDLCYPGLNNVAKLVKKDPISHVYVAAFSDNVGSKVYKQKLTQAQAETMLTFLWANKIPARQLNAEGYADKHPIANDKLIHGSAMNRRIEIQWIIDSQHTTKEPWLDKFGKLIS